MEIIREACLSCTCILAQVECKPPGPIQLKVVNYRQSGGGFLAVAPTMVAGNAAIGMLELRTSPRCGWGGNCNLYAPRGFLAVA